MANFDSSDIKKSTKLKDGFGSDLGQGRGEVPKISSVNYRYSTLVFKIFAILAKNSTLFKVESLAHFFHKIKQILHLPEQIPC